jgi:hypothetical protein
MNDTDVTPTTPTTPTATFAVARKIVKGGLLRILTGEALAMYLLIASKLRVTQECAISDFAMTMELDMPQELVRATRNELRARGLIACQRTKQGGFYRLA